MEGLLFLEKRNVLINGLRFFCLFFSLYRRYLVPPPPQPVSVFRRHYVILRFAVIQGKLNQTVIAVKIWPTEWKLLFLYVIRSLYIVIKESVNK